MFPIVSGCHGHARIDDLVEVRHAPTRRVAQLDRRREIAAFDVAVDAGARTAQGRTDGFDVDEGVSGLLQLHLVQRWSPIDYHAAGPQVRYSPFFIMAKEKPRFFPLPAFDHHRPGD